jgi:FAD:protein FMN transferase
MPSFPAPDPWAKRAQAWLGTLVEVSLPTTEASEPRFAAAFAAIAHIHRKMSAHDPRSDLRRIGRCAHRRAVAVDRDTYAVLGLAIDLARSTGGAFDATVAPVLVRRGLLPAGAAGYGARCGRTTGLQLLRGHRVRSAARVALDLGGIAKGYAVDRAVAALRDAGVTAGIVNAGGDLRVFGAEWTPVHVRDPADPVRTMALVEVRDAAVATSADYFHGEYPSLVDPARRRARPFGASITVVASTCALADALTKVVALDPERSAKHLARHGAHGFRLESGAERAALATTCNASTAHLRLNIAAAA